MMFFLSRWPAGWSRQSRCTLAIALGVVLLLLLMCFIDIPLSRMPEPIAENAELFAEGSRITVYLTLIMGLAWFFIARKEGITSHMQRPTPKEMLRIFMSGLWALLLPVIIIVGLRGGVFTAHADRATVGGAAHLVVAFQRHRGRLGAAFHRDVLDDQVVVHLQHAKLGRIDRLAVRILQVEGAPGHDPELVVAGLELELLDPAVTRALDVQSCCHDPVFRPVV